MQEEKLYGVGFCKVGAIEQNTRDRMKDAE